MHKLIVIALVSQLTGCTGMLNMMDHYAMNSDPCLRAIKNNTDIPDFCGKGSGLVTVRSYYRRDGTYVASHVRSAPDGNPYNNFTLSARYHVDSLGRIIN